MTVSLEAPPTRSASLTTSALDTLQRVWHVAGLPPTSGYATALVAMAVATSQTLVATLTMVDFDDSDSMANAVEQLRRWREHAFRATA